MNPLVLDVDETLLLNVNTRIDLIAAGIAEWASERDDVRAALVVGSQARSQLAADRWSDLDAVLFADYPRALAAETDWVENFGTPVLTFLEETGFGAGIERRVLYETGEDVDFPIVDATAWREVAALPETADMLSRGYRLLYDELELGKELARLARPLASSPTRRRRVPRARERLLVPRALGREEAPARRGVHGDGMRRRISEVASC